MMRVAILVEDYFDERELIFPLYRFKEIGASVDLVGPEIKEYHGKQGFRIKANVKADPKLAEKYDAIWIPGGYAPDRLRRYENVLSMVRKAYEKGRIIAAVCHAPWVLISSGIIKGKKVTSFYAIHDDIKNAGAILLKNKNAVRDRNLVTGTDPDAMPSMFKYILDILKEKGMYKS